MNTYSGSDPINVGTGEDITIRELTEMVASVIGFKGEVEWDTTKPDGTPRKLLNIQKLKDLGWSPSITLEDGIRSTYEWYISGNA
jgi:GDP-L-fucose synthase